jgi:hypothetical protein
MSAQAYPPDDVDSDGSLSSLSSIEDWTPSSILEDAFQPQTEPEKAEEITVAELTGKVAELTVEDLLPPPIPPVDFAGAESAPERKLEWLNRVMGPLWEKKNGFAISLIFLEPIFFDGRVYQVLDIKRAYISYQMLLGIKYYITWDALENVLEIMDGIAVEIWGAGGYYLMKGTLGMRSGLRFRNKLIKKEAEVAEARHQELIKNYSREDFHLSYKSSGIEEAKKEAEKQKLEEFFLGHRITLDSLTQSTILKYLKKFMSLANKLGPKLINVRINEVAKAKVLGIHRFITQSFWMEHPKYLPLIDSLIADLRRDEQSLRALPTLSQDIKCRIASFLPNSLKLQRSIVESKGIKSKKVLKFKSF